MVSTARQGWRDLLAGGNAARSLVLAGGVGLHAVNIFIVTTILPSVVADIGGLAYYPALYSSSRHRLVLDEGVQGGWE